MSRATLLALGDIHLGRCPAGLSRLRGVVDPISIGPRVALQNSVEEAIRRSVDAVLFAGDVVEHSNSLFEAHGVLGDALERLARAGIQAIAVAGNHDVEALPRLARQPSLRFKLLGEGGRWECVSVHGRGEVRVLGWSFPAQHVHISPLPPPAMDPRTHQPTIGLLHGDLGTARSVYAPLSRGELESVRGVDAWLLGHIHASSLDPSATRPIGYLGSLVGLDPTETGTHGPWLVEVGDSGVQRLEQLALAPLHWSRLDVVLEDGDDAAKAEDRVLASIEQETRRIQDSAPSTKVLGIRARLSGRPRARAGIESHLRERDTSGAWLIRSSKTVTFVESLVCAFKDAASLEELARGSSPAARVAQKIQLLEAAGPEAARLVLEARERLASVSRLSSWSGLEWHADDDSIRRDLLGAAWDTLHELEDSRAGREADA